MTETQPKIIIPKKESDEPLARCWFCKRVDFESRLNKRGSVMVCRECSRAIYAIAVDVEHMHLMNSESHGGFVSEYDTDIQHKPLDYDKNRMGGLI